MLSFPGIAFKNQISILSYTVASIPSETFNAGTFVSQYGYGSVQLNRATMGSAGSHTFTCTSNTSGYYQFIVVYDYTGGAGTLNTQVANPSASGTTLSSGPFTTTAATITVACVAFGATNSSVGTVNGNTATNSVTHSDTNWWRCEDYSSSTAFSSGTATVLTSGSTFGAVAAMSIQ